MKHVNFEARLHDLQNRLVPFGLDSGFRLLGVRLAVHVYSHLVFGR